MYFIIYQHLQSVARRGLEKENISRGGIVTTVQDLYKVRKEKQR